jgi:hypothetical protein
MALSTAEAFIKSRGPFVSGRELRDLLGYQSAQAFRQAAQQNRLPVPIFKEPGRRAWMARTLDVATWLGKVDQRLLASATMLSCEASRD